MRFLPVKLASKWFQLKCRFPRHNSFSFLTKISRHNYETCNMKKIFSHILQQFWPKNGPKIWLKIYFHGDFTLSGFFGIYNQIITFIPEMVFQTKSAILNKSHKNFMMSQSLIRTTVSENWKWLSKNKFQTRQWMTNWHERRKD